MVSCEIDVTTKETPVVNLEPKVKVATANELGVLAHLVSESVIDESGNPDALACGVALTVCCP